MSDGFIVAHPLTVHGPILALGTWKDNGVLIADIARLGRYLHNDMRIWDATWGTGTFWATWTPGHLVGTDGDADKGAPHGMWDARVPWLHGPVFDAVVWDPPYKLNGKPTDPDRPYGVDVRNTRDGRHALMCDGLIGCILSTRIGGFVLAKSMIQVNSGRKWDQPRMLTETAEANGCRWVDEFIFPNKSYRPQPDRKVRCPECNGTGAGYKFEDELQPGTACDECDGDGKITVPFKQEHAASNYSTLRVFERTTDTTNQLSLT